MARYCHKGVLKDSSSGAFSQQEPNTYVHWVFPIYDFAAAMFKNDHATMVLLSLPWK